MPKVTERGGIFFYLCLTCKHYWTLDRELPCTCPNCPPDKQAIYLITCTFADVYSQITTANSAKKVE